MSMSHIIIITVCALSVFSPLIGELLNRIFPPSGDAAGKGMASGLLVLFTMALVAFIGGIIAVLAWIFSEERVAIYARIMVFYTFIAPVAHIYVTEELWPKIRDRLSKKDD